MGQFFESIQSFLNPNKATQNEVSIKRVKVDALALRRYQNYEIIQSEWPYSIFYDGSEELLNLQNLSDEVEDNRDGLFNFK